MKSYHYVGPDRIIESADFTTPRHVVVDADGLLSWLWDQQMIQGRHELVTLTYVVLTTGNLCVADRRSEHVVCARKERVLTAGELTLECASDRITVVGATNYSTGYCPEVESWPALQTALEKAGLGRLTEWTQAMEFRRCDTCGMIALIKDEVYECFNCQAELPERWNFPDEADEGRGM
jgi:hypothetical protein